METIVERVRRVCQEHHISVSQMEKDLGFGNGFLNPKKIKTISADRLFMIADYLGASPEYLTLGYERGQSVSAVDLQMIEKIRALDEHGKKMVSMVLEEETRRLREKTGDVGQTKVIPLFGTSAAAGPGEPDTGLPWEDYDVPVDSRGEFAVRISGDSMEPVLHDGQIALCTRHRPQIGDVTVIMINGAMLVKQYIADNYGNIYLRSLNRARKDCDYDVKATGNDTVMCYGTVILPRRPALAD